VRLENCTCESTATCAVGRCGGCVCVCVERAGPVDVGGP
jgi:hypothetical protein